ncbi:MAG: hypothetical protein ACRDL5_03010 [Solirubrobacteraceae bacterium]
MAVAVAALAALTCVSLAAPDAALAHGMVDPAASSFEAHIKSAPAGLDAKVVDGDLRLWLQVPARARVTILDYRGAPFLRFSRAGVQVNVKSPMYYLNLVPPIVPPTDLGPNTRPVWVQESSGHSYEWHDGRLQDLAEVALLPGTRYVGRWIIPLVLNGRRTVIAGGLWYTPDPPLVWFWPVIVVLVCLPAVLRLRRPELDRAAMRWLGIASVFGFAVLAIGRGFHGRPGLSAWSLTELGIELAFGVWALQWLIRARHHVWLGLMLIGAVAVWGCVTTFSVLTRGYVLLALPPWLGRVATVVCLAAGPALVLLSIRMALASPEASDSPPAQESSISDGERSSGWGADDAAAVGPS